MSVVCVHNIPPQPENASGEGWTGRERGVKVATANQMQIASRGQKHRAHCAYSVVEQGVMPTSEAKRRKRGAGCAFVIPSAQFDLVSTYSGRITRSRTRSRRKWARKSMCLLASREAGSWDWLRAAPLSTAPGQPTP